MFDELGKNAIPSHTYNGRVQQSRYETPDSPLRSALKCITGQEPPDFVRGYDYRDMTEEESEKLQEWAVNAIVDAGYEWMTGIGTIEAAIHMVKCAEENGNIGTNPRSRRMTNLQHSRRALAISKSYAEGGTLAETAAKFGISVSAAKDAINRAFNRTGLGGESENLSLRKRAEYVLLQNAVRCAAESTEAGSHGV